MEVGVVVGVASEEQNSEEERGEEGLGRKAKDEKLIFGLRLTERSCDFYE